MAAVGTYFMGTYMQVMGRTCYYYVFLHLHTVHLSVIAQGGALDYAAESEPSQAIAGAGAAGNLSKLKAARILVESPSEAR